MREKFNHMYLDIIYRIFTIRRKLDRLAIGECFGMNI